VAQAGDPLGLQGTVIDGKYVLGRAAGEGGAAIVYRAENTVWQVPVAVKFFVALSQAAPSEQASLLADFTQEGRLVADLSTRCSAIVQPRDFGVLRQPGQAPLPYLVLEWLDGKSLDDVLVAETLAKIPPRTLDEAMRLLEPVATALSLAHELGIAHRDIKPENMMVVGDARGPDAQIKLLDFGIAKVMKRRLEGVHQTGTMPTAFTPHYGAPEQFSRGFGETGPWTDVFALALVLLEVMRGGARAFSGDDYMELGQQSMDESSRPTPRKLRLTVSDDVEAVFARALAVQPQHRYEDVRSFWQAIVGASRPGAPAWRPPGQSIPPPPATPSRPLSKAAAPRRSIVLVAAALGVLLIVGAAVAAGVRAAKTSSSDPSRSSSNASGPAASSVAASPQSSAGASASAGAPQPEAALCPAGSLVVSGGRFLMGTSAEGLEGAAPEHVTYVDTFCLDRAEATVQDYVKCIDAGKCPSVPGGPGCRAGTPSNATLAMNCVSHGEAEAFCSTRGMRLPTEAEWEYAASSPAKDGPVDLVGGVAEWVADFMGPYGEGQQVNPKGPETGTQRVVRGGSLRGTRAPNDKPDATAKLATKAREGAAPAQRVVTLGFRCAKSIR
jgi:eukaryotic-like serine/threonine-protein kinase